MSGRAKKGGVQPSELCELAQLIRDIVPDTDVRQTVHYGTAGVLLVTTEVWRQVEGQKIGLYRRVRGVGDDEAPIMHILQLEMNLSYWALEELAAGKPHKNDPRPRPPRV